MIRVPDDFACVAVETSTEVCSVAACRDGRLAHRRQAEGPDRSRAIFRLVREVLEELNLELGTLDCVAFGRGPGGFTGLRVGAAVAQSLAFGAGLPVCPVSSLATLALGGAQSRGLDDVSVAACLDARMGEVYAACFHCHGDRLRPLDSERVCAPERLVLPSAGPFLAVGPGWRAYPGLREKLAPALLDADGSAIFPDAADLLQLAAAMFRDGATVAPDQALPNYLRDQVTG